MSARALLTFSQNAAMIAVSCVPIRVSLLTFFQGISAIIFPVSRLDVHVGDG